MEPKISIIIPVYNVERYLSRCLDSLVNQSLNELEIICVNDGSTDHSGEILSEYEKKDKRIIVINQENGGVSLARNNGLNFAKGEFIGFVDADDTVEKDFYKLLYEKAKKHKAEIACGEIRRPDSARLKDKKTITYHLTRTTKNTTQKYRLCKIPKRNYIWNKIYKRAALLESKVEFEEGVVYEDIFWSHEVLDKLGKLVVVPKAIYNHYWNYRAGGANYIEKTKPSKGYGKNFIESQEKSVEYAFIHKIRIPNYKHYTPPKRIKVHIAGIRFFDFRIWDCVKVVYILGIEVMRIFVNNNSR